MNPAEIEKDIRSLELMLYGGVPLRPDADFGQGEVGYFESVKARDPIVHVAPRSKKSKTKELVLERRVLNRDGKIVVAGPNKSD